VNAKLRAQAFVVDYASILVVYKVFQGFGRLEFEQMPLEEHCTNGLREIKAWQQDQDHGYSQKTRSHAGPPGRRFPQATKAAKVPPHGLDQIDQQNRKQDCQERKRGHFIGLLML
jgi:hypothetical protein